MTRKLAGFGLAFALAELAAAYLPPLASLLTAALFISLFLFAAFTQRRAARFALPAVAGLLAALAWSAAYQLAVVKPAQSLAGQTYACTAIVQPDAETSWQPGNVRATLLITRLDGRKTSLKVYCTDLPYSEAGDIITGQFQLQPLRADSYRMSRYAKGTWLGASYQADYIWQGTSDALPYRLYHLRQAFAKRLTTYLPQNLAGVEAAMLLGEKSELTDEWRDTFRTAGIAHLLAVSGLHVALLCGLFAMGQGRRSRFSVPRVLLQITILLLYMGLTGLPFSVFRAGVMFLIMLVGSLLLQPPDSLTALALAAIIIGVQQPFAPCDIGFQLSDCGVLGVLAASALAKRQTQFVQVRYAARNNQRRQTALPLPLAIVLRAVDAVQTAVLATLATLPVLLLHGMAASGAAVPANLLVVWLFTGLWHGSTLNFLLWGLFLFALISLERLGWGKVLRRSQVISRLYMLLVIPLSWMLFAIPSLKDIGSYIGRLFAFSGGTAVHARDFLVYGRQYAVVLVIGLLVSTPLPEKLWRRIRTSPLGTVLLLVLFWVCVYCMAVATNDPFMYFSF